MLIEYIRDADVDAKLDADLRTLLSSCFTGEGSAIFARQRFFNEMPPHRWLVRDSAGQLVAHLAVHDKIIGTTIGDLRVGGLAEVCVTASQRGQGLVRRLVALSDQWMLAQDIPFGALLGDFRIYGSSGYRHIVNPIRYLVPPSGEWKTEPMDYFLIKPLGIIDWPHGLIDLRGPKF